MQRLALILLMIESQSGLAQISSKNLISEKNGILPMRIFTIGVPLRILLILRLIMLMNLHTENGMQRQMIIPNLASDAHFLKKLKR